MSQNPDRTPDEQEEPRYGVRRTDLPPGTYPPPITQSENTGNDWNTQPLGTQNQTGMGNIAFQRNPLTRPGLMITACVFGWIVSAFGLLTAMGSLAAASWDWGKLHNLLVQQLPPSMVHEFNRNLDQLGGPETLPRMFQILGITSLVFSVLLLLASCLIFAGQRSGRLLGIILASFFALVGATSLIGDLPSAVVILGVSALMIVGWAHRATGEWMQRKTQARQALRGSKP